VSPTQSGEHHYDLYLDQWESRTDPCRNDHLEP
jgi:hypothetical protein